MPLVLRGKGRLTFKATPPATERGSLRSTDKRRVTVLPKRGFRRRKDVRARCTRGTDKPGTSSPLVRMGGLTLQSERESLMVKNMEDHTAIQKGRAPTAPKRKAHTAIRSGELPRGLKERAPYMNQGRSHSAIKTGEPTLRPHSNGRAWMVSGWGSPHGDSNGRAHSRSGSFHQSKKGELSLHPDEKRSLAGLGKWGNAEY